MSTDLYQIDFISEVDADLPSDGLDMVVMEEVAIDKDKKIRSVYEDPDYDTYGDQTAPFLSTHLSNIKTVKCQNFRSGHGSLKGGRIELCGTFERGNPERITIKLHFNEYKPFFAMLQLALDGEVRNCS
jgi:hypothetical protein